MTNTTALLRAIDRQDQAARDAAWDDRSAGTRRRPPKWAVDHLLDTGAITPAQHDAALRFASAIERGFGGDPLPAPSPNGLHLAWDTSFAAEVDRTARALDRAQSREVARTARFAVLRTLRRYKTAAPVLGLLFAFNGFAITGPRASWKMVRSRGKGQTNANQCEREVDRVLHALMEHFDAMDRGYGPAAR